MIHEDVRLEGIVKLDERFGDGRGVLCEDGADGPHVKDLVALLHRLADLRVALEELVAHRRIARAGVDA